MLVRLTSSLCCALLLSTARGQIGDGTTQSAQSAAVAAAAAQALASASAGTHLGQLTSTVVVTPIDPTISVIPVAADAGETTLSLDIGWGVRYVPPSRVTVPVGELLRINAPAIDSTAAPGGTIQWKKNGQPIPGATGPVFVLNPVHASDAGTYQANFQTFFPTLNREMASQPLFLSVAPSSRLLNLSTRVTLNAGPGQNFMSGFIVSGNASTAKKLIIRAVGPTLASFGVPNPLKKPVLRVYDAAGQPYPNNYVYAVYAAVVGGVSYDTDLAESLARAGAFPTPAGSDDAVVMMPFLPGSYSAEVSSGDLAGGMVLLEIYEVP
jgi:hypothetical protein